MPDIEQPSAAPVAPRRRRPRARAIAAVVLGLLACVALVATTTIGWIHQVALNTDRFVALTSAVVEDPAVIDSLSHRVSQQVVVALDVEGRLATALPGNAKLLAGPIAGSVEDRLQVGLANLMQTEGFQRAWEQSTRFAHQQIVAILRGDSTVITIDNGVVTLNVFPLVNGALATLQAEGVIPASVTLPELSASSTPSVARTALQSALGITLPADFGTIALVQADRLEAAQTAVRVFDLLVIVAIVVTILLFVAAAYIARDRRRAVILLGVGAVIALLVARAGLRGLENAIVDSVANADGAVIARGLFDTVLNDLFGLMVIVTAIGAAVAIVAWLIGRREQIRELAGSTGSVVRQKTAAGTGAAKAMAASASDRAGGAAAGGAAAAVPATVVARTWARANLRLLRLSGIAVAAAWLAIIAVGWEPVVVIGALLVLFEVGLEPLLGESADGTETAAEAGA